MESNRTANDQEQENAAGWPLFAIAWYRKKKENI
jgi:hypothetical protein